MTKTHSQSLGWKPSASVDILAQRAVLLRRLRQFFDKRGVLEVETPLFATHGVTEPQTPNMRCQYLGEWRYLQTSPEYHLKRLLCAGMPDCYQLAKVFRDEPAGTYHQPEFTMLEWYRRNMDYLTLANEVLVLIETLTEKTPTAQRWTYQQLFQAAVGWQPDLLSTEDLAANARSVNQPYPQGQLTKDDWCAWWMAMVIEPWMRQQGGVHLVYDFPASQAALAVVKGEVAQRFEIYCQGIELANGFQELMDSQPLKTRFESDNLKRSQCGLPTVPIDSHFLQALTETPPLHCSGVAVGVDRLMMLSLGQSTIREVISFSL